MIGRGRRRVPRVRIVLGAFSVLAATLIAAPHGGAAYDRTPVTVGPCTPDPSNPMDAEVRPPGCKRIRYRYGPLHITPGDNLILFGPILLEKPTEDGYIARFKPDLVRVTGEAPPIEELHLHHAVWLSTGHRWPWAASGEEKTLLSLPSGYGVRASVRDQWLLNFMLHNQLATPDNVFVTYEIDFVPMNDAALAGLVEVEPVWLNVASFNGANPVYNSLQGYGSILPGRCVFPKENCAVSDPYGARVQGNGIPGNGVGWSLPVGSRGAPSGTVVWMGGHLHPGGTRMEVALRRGGDERRVFNSDAVYMDPGGPVSWDMAMEVTKPDFRLRIEPGDQFVVNSVYDSSLASWYEGMGIVVLFVVPGDESGPSPWDPSFAGPDHVAVTHGHLKEADRHGGPDGAPPVFGRGLPVGHVAIGGFAYAPGNLGTTELGVPEVRRGAPLRFVNLDAPAAIFHTVTSCRAPCNGPTGISYPLANGPVEFDSLQLGFGPPGLTAAANRTDYTLDTSRFAPGEYTYFCRVHPSMRGAFRVTA